MKFHHVDVAAVVVVVQGDNRSPRKEPTCLHDGRGWFTWLLD